METQKRTYHGDLSSTEACFIPANPPRVLRATRGSFRPLFSPSTLLFCPPPPPSSPYTAATATPVPVTHLSMALASKKQHFIDQEAKFKLGPSQKARAAKARECFQL